MHPLALALALAAAGVPQASPAVVASPPVPVIERIQPAPALPALVSGAGGAMPAPAAPPVPGSPAVSPAKPAVLPASSPAAMPQPATVPTAPTTAQQPAPAAVSPPAAAAPPAPEPLSQAAVEKLGQGDRAFSEGDYRSALFAYQDAVYLAPRSPLARVKLGRAYLALRYPAQAIAQAEQALAADPGSLEARRLLDAARLPLPRIPAVAAAPERAPAASADATAEPGSPGRTEPQPRVFRFTPEPDEPGSAPNASAGVAPVARPETALTTGAGEGASAPTARTVAAVRADPPIETKAPAMAPAPSAAQRYRDAIALLSERQYERADAALTEAIELDPRLAVAHAARGSARVGLRRHRDAADDYRAALALDSRLATPLYGLAECYRALGDASGAADMYQRYAQSRAPDVREELRAIATKRAQELR